MHLYTNVHIFFILMLKNIILYRSEVLQQRKKNNLFFWSLTENLRRVYPIFFYNVAMTTNFPLCIHGFHRATRLRIIQKPINVPTTKRCL